MKKVFGTAHERELKRLQPLVVAHQPVRAAMRAKSDAELRAMTPALKAEARPGRQAQRSLARGVRRRARGLARALGMRHYDVQLLGGMVLNKGSIAEMKTGEGKTLVATCPLYLNALDGRGCHLVTVNDYLATPRRRMDGPHLQVPRHDRGRRSSTASRIDENARRTTAPTSPTAPTTSSASITCATT